MDNNTIPEESTKQKLKKGCLTLLKGILGIVFIGTILSIAMNKDKEHDREYPWYGSVWYIYTDSISVFDNKQFKTLEECREWAKKQAETKNLEDGKWDYSCGNNCSYTDQSISGGRKINTYECKDLTK